MTHLGERTSGPWPRPRGHQDGGQETGLGLFPPELSHASSGELGMRHVACQSLRRGPWFPSAGIRRSFQKAHGTLCSRRKPFWQSQHIPPASRRLRARRSAVDGRMGLVPLGQGGGLHRSEGLSPHTPTAGAPPQGVLGSPFVSTRAVQTQLSGNGQTVRCGACGEGGGQLNKVGARATVMHSGRSSPRTDGPGPLVATENSLSCPWPLT